jgi:hypothetical protein
MSHLFLKKGVAPMGPERRHVRLEKIAGCLSVSVGVLDRDMTGYGLISLVRNYHPDNF